MTNFEVWRIPFVASEFGNIPGRDVRRNNWPIVYTITGENEIYIGESVNGDTRMLQHIANPARAGLTEVNYIVDGKFNKSACLDLEAHLIQYFQADEKFRVQNSVVGVRDADYFDRDEYRRNFQPIFDWLVSNGMITRPIPELINSDFFKYSPFKALNTDQAIAIESVLEKLIEDFENSSSSPIVIEGDPGTGKTIVAVYLMKLIQDIALSRPEDLPGDDALFHEYFLQGNREAFQDLRIALVVPQQALRRTISKVFAKTPGLSKDMVLTPWDVAKADGKFDLLIVDEAHRLKQRSNQSSAALNIQFKKNNENLFGKDDVNLTQLDWIREKSKHQIFLLDAAQSVIPGDIPRNALNELKDSARSVNGMFRLTSQMRVLGGNDYIEFVDNFVRGNPAEGQLNFGYYDLRFFDSFKDMQTEILKRESEVKLSRLLAGYGWKWVTKGKADPKLFDIEIEGVKLPWNRQLVDWISTPSSHQEVGSIHTIQGYDLNYAGVIFGPELKYDKTEKRISLDRQNYFDTKGKEDNRLRGIVYTDDDILDYVLNVYRVLMTRGIKGTYVYVVDKDLRSFLRTQFK
jgi:DUF2075 family protein